MKPTTLARSFALGLGIGLAIFGLVSLAPQAGSEKGAFRVYLDPLPSSIVRVSESQAFTVPSNRILVIKHLGDANGSSLSTVRVLVDGEPMAAVQLGSPGGAGLAFPVTAKAGSVVTVEESFPDPNTLAFAAGYLAAF